MEKVWPLYRPSGDQPVLLSSSAAQEPEATVPSAMTIHIHSSVFIKIQPENTAHNIKKAPRFQNKMASKGKSQYLV